MDLQPIVYCINICSVCKDFTIWNVFSAKIVTVHSYFLFFCMVRNGNCPGYPLRTVIWGKTVFYAGHTHAKSHAYSCNCKHTPCYYMGKHKTCFTSSRSRSWHIEDSRRVCLFHGPEPICIWSSSMSSQILANSKHCISNDDMFWNHNFTAHSYLLVHGFQI